MSETRSRPRLGNRTGGERKVKSMKKVIEIMNNDRVWLVFITLVSLAALGLALGIIPDGARQAQ